MIICRFASFFAIFFLFSSPWADAEPKFYAAARSVLGQPDFETETVVSPASAQSLNYPEGVAVDPVSGKVFVADSENNRILRFSSTEAYQISGTAEAVFGQADFMSSDPNRGGSVAANTLSYPLMLAMDSAGRLWVTDYENYRVLRFDDAANKSSGADADGVIGQPDLMTAAQPITPAPMAGHSKMADPTGIAVDMAGNLYVADSSFHRVLRFDNAAAKSFEATADAVFGQPDLDSADNSVVSGSTMNGPYGVSIGPDGELWVADTMNSRVLRFDDAATFMTGGSADGVLGQMDLDSDVTYASPTRSSMEFAYYVSAQGNGTLWVSDYSHVRVLGFRNAAQKADGAPADTLLGLPTYTESPHDPASRRTLVGPCQVAFGKEGSLFVAVWDQSRVMRFSDEVTIRPDKKRLKTSANRVTVKGRATGASRIQVKVAGRGGYKNAKGSVRRWKRNTGRLKKNRTRITIRGTAFDGKTGRSKMLVIKK